MYGWNNSFCLSLLDHPILLKKKFTLFVVSLSLSIYIYMETECKKMSDKINLFFVSGKRKLVGEIEKK